MEARYEISLIVEDKTHLNQGCCIFDPSSLSAVHPGSVCKLSATLTFKERHTHLSDSYLHPIFLCLCASLFASMYVSVCCGAYLVCGVEYAYLTIILLQQLAPNFVSLSLKRTVRSNDADVSSVYLRKCDSYSLIHILISGRYFSRLLTLHQIALPYFLGLSY